MARLADLQAECAAAGLATWGSIPQLEARLEKHRADSGGDAGDDDPVKMLEGDGDADADDGPGDGGKAPSVVGGDAGSGTPGSDPAPPEVQPVQTPPADPPADESPNGSLLEFTARYVTHGPPDDVAHQQLCHRVREEAIAAGHTPRGWGYRVRTVWDRDARYDEYAISLRRQ